MNIIPITGKDEPRADTRALAEGLGLQHQNVFEMVKDYQGDFEQLGKLRFETGPSVGSRTGQKLRFALLNEDQCYLLLTFSRNTAKVRSLKVRLVMAFREARANREMTMQEYLPSYHGLHEIAHEKCAGSPNERFVHMNLNRLVNKTVGIDAGQRQALPMGARAMTVVAQMTAANAMASANDHHDGYQAAKEALSGLGRVLLGKAA